MAAEKTLNVGIKVGDENGVILGDNVHVRPGMTIHDGWLGSISPDESDKTWNLDVSRSNSEEFTYTLFWRMPRKELGA